MDFDELKAELHKRRLTMYKEWNRVLPTNELLFDRWDKARLLKAGEDSSCYDTSIVMGEVEIGKHVWIGPFTLLDGTGGGLRIGHYCNISAGVQIYTHDTVNWSLSGGKLPKKTGQVAIEDNCYIAPMSIISNSVSIGKCSIVAANSFVNKSFPPYSIIAGTPAQRIGEVIKHENGEIELKYYKNK